MKAQNESHPSRVRGLKLVIGMTVYMSKEVAPFTGAWIETFFPNTVADQSVESHPSRVRGLKRPCQPTPGRYYSSHPSRVRGLKLV